MHKHEHDDHHHDHHHAASDNRRRLKFVLGLTATYMLAEAVGGYLANSLALLSDAGHMLADVASVGLAMFALWFSSRPANTKKTYGYYRLEILAALANGVTLVVISVLIFLEALHRLREPEAVEGVEVLFIAFGGLFVNGISAWLLHAASAHNLNMRGAFLHVVGDALGSVGAILAGLLIWQFGWTIADPVISVLMCVLIVFSSWQIIRDSVNVLLEGTPSHINVNAVIEAMQQVERVVGVHDLHVWTISSGKDALSAHVTIASGASYKAALEALQAKLLAEFNISHATIQIEMPDEEESMRLYQITGKSR
jgi:cobalt-zinc-cadmium efflux system protein